MRISIHPIVAIFLSSLLFDQSLYALPQGPFVEQDQEKMVWQQGGNPNFILQPRLLWQYSRKYPSFADIDADGDSDLILVPIDEYYMDYPKSGVYLENIGNNANPAYALSKLSPFKNTEHGELSSTAWDLDNDGDLDWIQRDNYSGKFYFVENIGNAFEPQFIQRRGADNPLEHLSYSYPPVLLDADNDGDADLLAVSQENQIIYIENIGTLNVPLFIERTGADNPWNGMVADRLAALDLDDDGDIDVVMTTLDGHFSYLENIGTPETPNYVERSGTDNPLSNIDSIGTIAPVDMDADGDWDLVIGPDMIYFKNQGTASAPKFEISENPWGGFYARHHAMIDPDGDNDWDIVVPSYGDRLGYFENIGTPTAPQYVDQSSNEAQNPFYNLGEFGIHSIVPIDADKDADTDLLMEDYAGNLYYVENIGSPTMPQYVERKGLENPWNEVNIIDIYNSGDFIDKFPSYFTAFDVDGDNDIDLVLGTTAGIIRYLENIGSIIAPQYVERTDATNPWNGIDTGWYSKPVAVDFDHDDDMDLLIISNRGQINYFENIGSPSSPQYIQRLGTDNPWDKVSVSSHFGIHTPVDLDADGDLDLLVSDDNGVLHYFENLNFSDHARIFNWAENLAPDILPLPAETIELPPLYIRSYPVAGVYLGYNSTDGHVYFFAPPYLELLDLGLLADYLQATQEAGF